MALGTEQCAFECGLCRRLHRHKYSSLLWTPKELKVMFLKPVRHTACDFSLKNPRLFFFLYFSFVFLMLCSSVLSSRKPCTWWMKCGVTNPEESCISEMLASFQLKPSRRHLLLAFFLRDSASLPAPFIWKKKKKKINTHHHLFILLHANLILQSGSSLFSSPFCRAPLLSTVSPFPTACWHFCLICRPNHLAHASLPTVVLWTVLQRSVFNLLAVLPPPLHPSTPTHTSDYLSSQ